MKRLAFVIILVLLGYAKVYGAETPDIIVSSKINENWSNILITKLKKLLRNYKIIDPLSQSSSETYIFDNMLLDKILPESSKSMLHDLRNISGLDILNAKPKVSMEGFLYEVKGLRINVLTGEETTRDLKFMAQLSAPNFVFLSDRLTLSLEATASGKKISVASIDIVNPSIRASAEDLIDFNAQLRVYDGKKDGRDVHKFEIIDADLDRLAENLQSSSDNIELNYDDVVIRSSQLKIGNKILSLDIDEIKSFIEANREGIKGLLLAQASKKLTSGLPESIKKLADKINLNKDHWINAKSIKIHTRLDKFSNPMNSGNASLAIPLNFCTHENFKKMGEQCLTSGDTNKVKSRIIPEMEAASVKRIQAALKKDDAHLVASISEDFFTKLLKGTHEAGLWDSILSKGSIFFGPTKARAIISQRGNTANFYLDIQHKYVGIEKLVMPFSHLRVPVGLKASIRLEKNQDDDTVLIVRLVDADLSDESLLKGRPDIGMPSNLGESGLFKNAAVDIIRKKVSMLLNRDVITLPLPDQLQGLGLEDVEFESDGLGRMNAYLKLEQIRRR